MNDYALDDLTVGLTQKFSITLTEAMMDDFRRLSGDDNLLHQDAQFARAKGFKDRVCYGLLISSFYSTLVGVYLPGKNALLQGLTISFPHPAYIGDRLEVAGEITHVSKAVRQIEIKARITNQAAETISSATIKAGLHG